MIPLTPGLCEALTEWRARHPAPDAARVVKITDRVLRKFDDDLVAAGLARRVPLDKHGDPIPLGDDGKPTATPAEWVVDKKDASGRTLDIHALRHTCGSRLVAAGVDIRTAQSIMRHSTPTMTLGIYCHTDRKRMAAAMESLPELKPAPAAKANREGRALAKTGTDAAPLDDDPHGGIRPASTSSERCATAQTAPSTRDQQGTTPLSGNGKTYNILEDNGRTFPKPKVEGSSPFARSISGLAETGQGSTNPGLRNTQPGHAPQVIPSLPDQSLTGAVQTASQLGHEKTETAPKQDFPPDLQAVMLAWPALPEAV